MCDEAKQEPTGGTEPMGTPLEPIDTYVDEQGRTIRICPPRFKPGTFMQGYTVRPRRRE